MEMERLIGRRDHLGPSSIVVDPILINFFFYFLTRASTIGTRVAMRSAATVEMRCSTYVILNLVIRGFLITTVTFIPFNSVTFVQTSFSNPDHDHHHSQHPILNRRDFALVTSPTGNYAPTRVACPENLYLRAPDKIKEGKTNLSEPEIRYIKERSQRSIPLWENYLRSIDLKDFDLVNFLDRAKRQGGIAGETVPNLGIALSGGGARACCLGGAILEAFDSRNPKAVEAKVAGILQLANYATGLSGTSWLLGALATSNFPTVSSLSPKWRLWEQHHLWDWKVVKFYPKVYKAVKKKKKAGFPTSMIDFWGRLLSRVFIDDPTQRDPNQGIGVLWSSIRETSGYKNREVPYVIVVTTSRPNPKEEFTPDSPIYEYSPEEFGLFHPHLNASIPIEYLGSTPTLPNLSTLSCVLGFDNAGFIMGMSSNIFSLFDQPRREIQPKALRILDALISPFVDDDDFEGKIPNTFRGLGEVTTNNSEGFQDNGRDNILMADCGFTKESIPIYPLIQPERKLDVIIAVDANTDTEVKNSRLTRYPNGTALYASYQRTLLPIYGGKLMPKIPNPYDGTFSKLGYHQRPTFFGCEEFESPLIIYLPNYYIVGKTNQPTTTTTLSPEEVLEFFQNGFAIASQNEGITKNPEWPACLACALIDRQARRNSASRTLQCQACFDQYCAVS